MPDRKAVQLVLGGISMYRIGLPLARGEGVGHARKGEGLRTSQFVDRAHGRPP
jgi:hypothetical protein